MSRDSLVRRSHHDAHHRAMRKVKFRTTISLREKASG